MENVDGKSAGVVDRSVLALLLVCATLTVMAGATISPSLPGLLDHFSHNPNAEILVPLILTIPGLAIAVSAPLCGMIVDKIDPRRVLIAGIILYVFAGSSGLYLNGLTAVIIGRAVLGLAVGAIMTASTTLIAILYAGPERGKILGFQASAMGFGGVIFILAGGFLADVSWRGPFAVYLAPVVLLPLIFTILPMIKREKPKSTDAPVQEFPTKLAMMIYPTVFLSFLIFYTIPTKLPFFLQELGATEAKTTGFAMGLIILAAAIMSLLYGRIRQYFRPETLAAISLAGLGVTFFLLSQAQSVNHIFAIAPLIGMNFGVLMPNFTTWLLAAVPQPMMGRANGALTMSVFLAQFLSAFVGTALVAMGGLRMVFWPMGVFSIALALFYLMVALRGKSTA